MDFWEERLTKSKELVTKIEDVLLNLEMDNTQSYTLDTGQSKQTVTKFDIGSLTNRRDKLLAQIDVLESRLYGSGVVIVQPYGRG